MDDNWLGVELSPSFILEVGRSVPNKSQNNDGTAYSVAVSDPDGRKRRSNTTKIKIADALLDLVKEGDYRPTARQIAVRAGVSERSVFQHFNDLNELHDAVGRRQFDRLVRFRKPIPHSLDFKSRLKRYISQRANILEDVTPIRRAMVVVELSSISLLQSRQEFHQLTLNQILEAFSPELESLSAEKKKLATDAIEAVSSWHTWESMRFQGNSIARSKKLLELIINSIFAQVL